MSLSDTDLIKIRKLLESGNPDLVRQGWFLVDDASTTEPAPELAIEVLRQAVAAKAAMLEALMRLPRKDRDRMRKRFAAQLVTPDAKNGCRGCVYDAGGVCGFTRDAAREDMDLITRDTPKGAALRWQGLQDFVGGYPDGPLVPCPGREVAE